MIDKPSINEIVEHELSAHASIFNSKLEVLSFIFSNKSNNFYIKDNYMRIFKFEEINENIDLNFIPEIFFLDPWENHTRENYSKFIGCKNDGFSEAVIYFYNLIKSTNVKQFKFTHKGNALTIEQAKRLDEKSKLYQDNLMSWKNNIELFKKDFGYIFVDKNVKSF